MSKFRKRNTAPQLVTSLGPIMEEEMHSGLDQFYGLVIDGQKRTMEYGLFCVQLQCWTNAVRNPINQLLWIKYVTFIILKLETYISNVRHFYILF